MRLTCVVLATGAKIKFQPNIILPDYRAREHNVLRGLGASDSD